MDDYIVKKVNNDISMYKIEMFINDLRNILFYGSKFCLKDVLKLLLPNITEDEYILFKKELKDVIEVLRKDLDSYYKFDPAVTSVDEIILCYPGFFAIWVYRIAHIFIKLNKDIVARMLTEYAHSKTGIDIHPKADIKEGFFIDHGTSVVIGSTSIIGKNVRMYHGVTLGAISLDNIDEVRDKKRHPTIGDNVTIYANATILGGNVKIGDNSIIGSNVFLTKSVNENTKVKKIPDNIL